MKGKFIGVPAVVPDGIIDFSSADFPQSISSKIKEQDGNML